MPKKINLFGSLFGIKRKPITFSRTKKAIKKFEQKRKENRKRVITARGELLRELNKDYKELKRKRRKKQCLKD